MKKHTIYLILLFSFATQILVKAQINKGNTISFATHPFNKNPQLEKEFKAGSAIYGKIVLEKSLKNYSRKLTSFEFEKFNKISGIYSDYIVLRVCEAGQNLETRSRNAEIKLYLKPSDLEKNTVIFDVMPTAEEASTLFGTSFYNEFASSSNFSDYFGKKIEITIYISEEGKNYNPDEQIPLGSLTIDYTFSDYETLEEWRYKCKEIEENIQTTYKK